MLQAIITVNCKFFIKKYITMNIQELQKNIVQNLKYLLESTKISIQDLSKITKVPISTLYSIINGISNDPKLSTLYALSEFFDITLSQLIGEISINWNEHNVPIIEWDNIDVHKKKKY